jgi:large subunit ribosomal protein L4
MPTAHLLNIMGEKLGEIELREEIFGQEISMGSIYQVVKASQANRAWGCASTKDRGEVSGGGRKPWRQKGTGRARAGSIRSPLWRGGGIIFGPKPRSRKINLPRAIRRKALLSVLSDKANNSEVIVLDELNLAEPKTREMSKLLSTLKVKKVLFVIDGAAPNVQMASRNIKSCKVVDAMNLDAYTAMNYHTIIFTKNALTAIEGRLLGGV